MKKVLVKNFLMEEFFENTTSCGNALKEFGTMKKIEEKVKILEESLQIIRDYLNRFKENEYSIIVTSGYRTEQENKDCFGAKNSLHRKIEAVDIIFRKNQKVIHANEMLTAEILGIINETAFKGIIAYEKTQGHYHLDIRKTPYFERK